MVLSRDVGPSQIMPEHIAVEPNYYPEVKLVNFVWFNL